MEDTVSFKPKSDYVHMEDTASFKPKSDYVYGRYRVL